MIRWLHISDLHIKNKADWNNFRTELKNHCKKNGKIDLVIVTGDFHDFDDKSDFSLAKEFLGKLMKELGLDIRKDLFVVPGNHDGVTAVVHKSTFVAAAQGKPVGLEGEWVKKLLEAFGDYEAFVRELIPDYPVLFPAQVHHRIWNNRINLIHCNTALIADGKQKKGQLMDIDNMAREEYRADIPNIILAHNSFYDLNIEHQKRVQDIVRNYPVCAYLCGDRHIGQVDQITYGDNQNRQIPCVVSYKSSPEPEDDYSVFGVIIGEWGEGKKTAYLKGWTWKSGKGFKIDDKITEQEIDMTGRLECSSVAEAPTPGKKVTEDKTHSDEQIKELEREEKSVRLQKQFITIYYSMTPAHIEAFNRKYNADGMRLKKKMSSQELYICAMKAKQKGLLDEMVCYITNLFKVK